VIILSHAAITKAGITQHDAAGGPWEIEYRISHSHRSHDVTVRFALRRSLMTLSKLQGQMTRFAGKFSHHVVLLRAIVLSQSPEFILCTWLRPGSMDKASKKGSCSVSRRKWTSSCHRRFSNLNARHFTGNIPRDKHRLLSPFHTFSFYLIGQWNDCSRVPLSMCHDVPASTSRLLRRKPSLTNPPSAKHPDWSSRVTIVEPQPSRATKISSLRSIEYPQSTRYPPA
jgi:hypothetical protein